MTRVRIDLAALAGKGDVPMSRGEARALATAFPDAGGVELDFAGIERIGPSFADELFRVFANAHPNLVLAPVNMTDAVSTMVQRAQAGRTKGESRQGRPPMAIAGHERNGKS